MVIATNDQKYVGPSRHALVVALVTILATLVLGLLVPAAKTLALIIPLVYIFVERRRSGRSWEEIGIKSRDFKKDFLSNWHLFLIVAVALQLPIPLLARVYWPDLLKHMTERIPFFGSSVIILIVLIVVIPFFEELVYRGLLQQRLSWYLNRPAAIAIASVVFALQHFTSGQAAIVAVDLIGVAIDGVFYGLIFARCRNIVVSWTAHVAADLVGLAILMSVIPRLG